MNIGKKNLLAGCLFVLVAALIGLCLSILLPFKYPDMSDAKHELLQHAYAQAIVVAFFNLLVGILLDKSKLSEARKKLTSIFALVALVQPFCTLLSVLWKPALKVEWIGTVGLLVAACILASAYTAVKKKAA